jgi:hypothetical protein
MPERDGLFLAQAVASTAVGTSTNVISGCLEIPIVVTPVLLVSSFTTTTTTSTFLFFFTRKFVQKASTAVSHQRILNAVRRNYDLLYAELVFLSKKLEVCGQ